MRARTQADVAQCSGTLDIATSGQGFTDLTREVDGWLESIRAGEGIVTVFVRHTSASLTIQENADPTVRHDLEAALDRLAPQGAGYVHSLEGPDDMPAHIRTMLTGVTLQIPVLDGAMRLGTWQAVYLVEHRQAPHRRSVALHFLGSVSDT